METPQDRPLPEASLKTLLSGIAAQAMVSLGVFPNPISGETAIWLHQGQHLISTVEMLNEKTKGSQTPEETKLFENVLHELRMVYVAAQEEQQRRGSGQPQRGDAEDA